MRNQSHDIVIRKPQAGIYQPKSGEFALERKQKFGSNFYRVPSGSSVVLEFRDGQYQIRSLSKLYLLHIFKFPGYNRPLIFVQGRIERNPVHLSSVYKYRPVGPYSETEICNMRTATIKGGSRGGHFHQPFPFFKKGSWIVCIF